MFEINYNFSDNTHTDITKADETDLRYHLFLGNLILKTRENSININWDWVPLFDFAVCLITTSNNLLRMKAGKDEFNFTESDERIIFQKAGDIIKISTTFSEEVLEMSFESFHETVKGFYKTIILDILNKNIRLRDNDTFLKYLKKAENM